MPEIFFFDTYAFCEIVRGNAKYSKYEDVSAITTIFNLAELSIGLKRELSDEEADKVVDKYAPLVVQVTIEDVKAATSLKKKNPDLSIPDAVGYLVAKRYNAKFLTGDRDFEKMPNVEFITK